MAQATTYGTCVRRWPDGVLVERTNSWPGFGGGGGGGGGEGGGGGGGGSGPTHGFARRGEGRNSCRKDELSECVLCTVYLVKGRDMKEQRKSTIPTPLGLSFRSIVHQHRGKLFYDRNDSCKDFEEIYCP